MAENDQQLQLRTVCRRRENPKPNHDQFKSCQGNGGGVVVVVVSDEMEITGRKNRKRYKYKKIKEVKKQEEEEQEQEQEEEKGGEEEEIVEESVVLLREPLVVFGSDLMLMILNNLDAQGVALCLLVSHGWNEIASHDSLWTKKCEELWLGKAHIPRLSPGISRLAAYSFSIMDARRTRIVREDLCDHVWEFRFKMKHRSMMTGGS